jgi:hypothetical protein
VRRILAVLLLLIIGFLGALSPTTVSAVDLNDTICSDEAQASRGVEPDICGDIEEAQGVDGVNPLYGPDGIVTRAIYGMSLAIGVVAMLVIIIGGIKMSLSSGDSGKVKGARDQVIYACVGLVVAGLAQAIVWLVLKRIGD